MEDPNCKNCGRPVAINYCANCGQRLITDRITVRYLAHQFYATITNVDRGFLFTLRKLFSGPEEVVLGYLGGRTRPYYPPLRYLVFMMAISVLLQLSFGIYDSQQKGFQNALGGNLDEKTVAMQSAVQEEVKKYLNLVVLLVIPFFALVSHWMYRKKGLNYAEHGVMNAYLFGQNALIGLPIMIPAAIFPSVIPYIPLIGFLFGAVYYTYATSRIMKVSLLIAFLKYLVIAIGGFFLFGLTAGFGGFIVGLIFALTK